MRTLTLLSIASLALAVSATPVQSDWSTVPDNKKFEQKGKLAPKGGVTDTHITFRKGGDHQVTNYQSWKDNGRGGMGDAGRFRGDGKPHGGVNPPLYYPANPGQKKQPARQARPGEMPFPKKGSKDDSRLGVKPKTNYGKTPKPKNSSPLKPLGSLGKPVGGRKGSKTVRELEFEEREFFDELEIEERDLDELEERGFFDMADFDEDLD